LEVVHSEEPEAWKTVYLKELNSGHFFQHPSNLPLFRMYLIPHPSLSNDQVIVTAFCHVIEDAASIVLFYHDILTECQRLLDLPEQQRQQQKQDEEIRSEPIPTLPIIFNIKFGIPGFFVFFFKLIKMIMLTGSQLPTGAKHIPISERRTMVSFLKLSTDETNNLVRKCKEKGTTVFAFTAAALLKEVSKFHSKGKRLAMSVPINMRDRVNPPLENKTIFPFMLPVQVLIDGKTRQQDIWGLAKSIKGEVNKKVETIREDFQGFAYSSLFFDSKGFEKYSNGRNQGVFGACGVSSLGIYPHNTKFSLQHSTPFFLKEFYRSVGVKICGEPFWMGSNTINGEFQFTFGTRFPTVSEEQHNQIVSNLLNQLTNLG